MLKMVDTFVFNGVSCMEYLCEEAGDELPLHSHAFNHLTKVTNGKILVFTDDGVELECVAGDPPTEYVAGRKHGIRGLTPGAMFMNIAPSSVDDHLK